MAKLYEARRARFWQALGFLGATFGFTGRMTAQAPEAFGIQPANTAASIAQVASAGGWDTSLTLVNLGAVPVGATLNFFDDSGNPLALPFTFPQGGMTAMTESTIQASINAHGVLLADTTGLPTQVANIGWSHLQAAGSVGGYALFTNTPNNWQAAVPLEAVNASSYLLAFDNTSGLSTGLAIANLSAQVANVKAVIRDDQGNLLGTEMISVPAQGHTSFMLNATYAVTAGIRGTIEFDTPAGGQINVLGLRVNGPALTTVPVLAQVGTGGGSMAQFTYNQGWESAFTLVNTGTSPAQATLSFYDDFGTPIQMSLTFPQTGAMSDATSIKQTLAAGASLIVQTNGHDGYKSVTGWAQLTTTGNVSGFAIFRFAPSQQEAVVPLETRNATTYVVPYDNTNGIITGLALANATDQAVNLGLIVHDENGAQIAGGAITLPMHGHTSVQLAAAYPGTAGIRGSVEISSPAGGQFSALGLRFTPNQNITTIPVLAK